MLKRQRQVKYYQIPNQVPCQIQQVSTQDQEEPSLDQSRTYKSRVKRNKFQVQFKEEQLRSDHLQIWGIIRLLLHFIH